MGTTRRLFLGAAAAAPAAARVRSPNDRIGLGIIGMGGRGRYHLAELAKLKHLNVAVVGVCDVYRPALDAVAHVKTTTDYRELLSWAEVDAVILSAPDFTHSQMLEDAVRAGKDVYCEKPMGVVFEEARRAYFAVRQSDRVVQIGTQRRSDPLFVAAAKQVQSGILGQITRVDMEVHFQEARWRRDYSHIRVEDIDWPRFLLGRSDRPPDVRRWREWQLFRDYTNGLPGLWMSHFIDLIPWYLGVPYPRSVAASGGVYLWKDGRETEDVFQALLDYPNDCLVRFAMSLTNASGSRNQWYGTRGTLDLDAAVISGAGSKLPDRISAELKLEPEPLESHLENFLRCVRSRQTPRASIQAGFSHTVAGCMAAEAARTGRTVRFDVANLQIV
jgi:predicted dehydrogenase